MQKLCKIWAACKKLEIDTDAAYVTAGTRCSISPGGGRTGESFTRVLLSPGEILQSEQQPNSREEMSAVRFCIQHKLPNLCETCFSFTLPGDPCLGQEDQSSREHARKRCEESLKT